MSQPAGISITELNARLLSHPYELAISKTLSLVHISDLYHELGRGVRTNAKKRKKTIISTDWHILRIT